jgi:hypothetical protein
MLPKALSCSHVYWGRVEGGACFILMLSVRILGDGGWQLLQVGPWLPSSPPPHIYAAFLRFTYVLGIVHCILTGPMYL